LNNTVVKNLPGRPQAFEYLMWVFTRSGYPELRIVQPVCALWNRDATWTALA